MLLNTRAKKYISMFEAYYLKPKCWRHIAARRVNNFIYIKVDVHFGILPVHKLKCTIKISLLYLDTAFVNLLIGPSDAAH